MIEWSEEAARAGCEGPVLDWSIAWRSLTGRRGGEKAARARSKADG